MQRPKKKEPRGAIVYRKQRHRDTHIFVNAVSFSKPQPFSESNFSLPSVCSDRFGHDDDVISVTDSEKSVALPSEVDETDLEELLEKDMDTNMEQNDANMASSKEVFAEFFSRPRMILTITALGLAHILCGTLSIDILTGYDLTIPAMRSNVMDLLKLREIKVVVLSPPCTMFSQMMRINFKKMNPQDLKRRWRDAMLFIQFTIRVIHYILSVDGFFVFEHPTGASSWRLPSVMRLMGRPGVKVAKFHQCRFGLLSPKSKLPIRKSTRFLTNSQKVVDAFDGCFCQCSGPHRVIEGSEGKWQLSKWCEQYPAGLCEALARSLAAELQ